MENEILENQQTTKKPNSFLKVLTILTFIGCAFVLYSSVSGYVNADANIQKSQLAKEKLEEQGQENSFMYKSLEKGIVMMEKQKENGVLFLIINVLGAALCIYGAIEMRKLHKMGYYSWLAGEFLPLIISVIILGTSMFSGFMLIGLLFPLAFAIMYGTQLKLMQ